MAGGNIYDKAKGKVKVSQLNLVIIVGVFVLAAVFFILTSSAKGLPVHFESNGGSKVSVQHAVFGEGIAEPEAPYFEGKTFAGWYKDEALTVPWNFAEDKISNGLTLYAKWE